MGSAVRNRDGTLRLKVGDVVRLSKDTPRPDGSLPREFGRMTGVVVKLYPDIGSGSGKKKTGKVRVRWASGSEATHDGHLVYTVESIAARGLKGMQGLGALKLKRAAPGYYTYRDARGETWQIVSGEENPDYGTGTIWRVEDPRGVSHDVYYRKGDAVLGLEAMLRQEGRLKGLGANGEPGLAALNKKRLYGLSSVRDRLVGPVKYKLRTYKGGGDPADMFDWQAYQGGVLVGFLSAQVEGKDYHLNTVKVLKAVRRKGVGSELLKRAVATSKKHGKKLFSSDFSDAGRALVESAGRDGVPLKREARGKIVLGATGQRGGGGLTLPIALLVAGGAFLVFKFLKARKEAADDGDGEYAREAVGTGPCSDIDSQLATPAGCGRVKATGYKRGVGTPITLAELPDYPGFYLQAAPVNVWGAFQRMLAAARQAGIRVGVNSAFRTMSKQTQLYQRYLDKTGNLAAKPGYSTHQLGFTVDLAVRANPDLLPWLDRNANRFGFFRTVSSEDWHWEYKPNKDQYSAVA